MTMRAMVEGLCFHTRVAFFAAALAACQIQVDAPTNDEILQSATVMHEEVAKFAIQVARAAGTAGQRADAGYARYQDQYDRWLAKIDTMEAQSLVGNHGLVDCGAVLRKIADMVQPAADNGATTNRIAALRVPAGTEAVDCQTAMIRALRIAVEQMGEYQKRFCTIVEPPKGKPAPASFAGQLRAFDRNCAGAFDNKGLSAIVFSGLKDAAATSETQGTLRAIMRVQEVKKAQGR